MQDPCIIHRDTSFSDGISFNIKHCNWSITINYHLHKSNWWIGIGVWCMCLHLCSTHTVNISPSDSWKSWLLHSCIHIYVRNLPGKWLNEQKLKKYKFSVPIIRTMEGRLFKFEKRIRVFLEMKDTIFLSELYKGWCESD